VSLSKVLRMISGHPGKGWPATRAVTPQMPPRIVSGAAMRATWIGHATVLLQTQGLNILTDPVWSDRVGPFGLFGPKRVQAPGVTLKDLPPIDVILISHNHFDHMDLATLKFLWRRDRPLIITSLGNDTILKAKGIPAVAKDWREEVSVKPGVTVIVERVHHSSSRLGADARRALWSGFTIRSPAGNVFFAGDTGWGDGKWIEELVRHSPFRLALLPIGAYEPREAYSEDHIEPQQAALIFRWLGVENAIGIHWGTFKLTEEGVDAPPSDLSTALNKLNVRGDRFRTLVPGASWDIPAPR